MYSSKINSGGVNENFVRIDITKKVFVRGHKKISGAKCKRNDWKLKKAAASKDEQMSKMKCRKCGEAGHFARFCTKGINYLTIPMKKGHGKL
jgi:ATP-dependent DNA helicase Q4